MLRVCLTTNSCTGSYLLISMMIVGQSGRQWRSGILSIHFCAELLLTFPRPRPRWVTRITMSTVTSTDFLFSPMFYNNSIIKSISIAVSNVRDFNQSVVCKQIFVHIIYNIYNIIFSSFILEMLYETSKSKIHLLGRSSGLNPSVARFTNWSEHNNFLKYTVLFYVALKHCGLHSHFPQFPPLS